MDIAKKWLVCISQYNCTVKHVHCAYSESAGLLVCSYMITVFSDDRETTCHMSVSAYSFGYLLRIDESSRVPMIPLVSYLGGDTTKTAPDEWDSSMCLF